MSGRRDPKAGDARLLGRFRYAAAGATLVIIVLYLLAGIVSFPFVRADFQLDPTILFGLCGFFGVLIGVEVLSKIPSIRFGADPEDKPE